MDNSTFDITVKSKFEHGELMLLIIDKYKIHTLRNNEI